MSSGPNHNRGHGRIQGNGPRFENPNPEAGCNSTHVARSRSKWKKINNRKLRRTGFVRTPFGARMLPGDEMSETEGMEKYGVVRDSKEKEAADKASKEIKTAQEKKAKEKPKGSK